MTLNLDYMNEANVPLLRMADAENGACITKKSNTVVLLSQTEGTWYDKIRCFSLRCLFLVTAGENNTG